jgi:hypothetical protein
LVSFFSSKQQMWENELHILIKYICIHILQQSLCSFLIWRFSSSAQLKVLCKVVACIAHYGSNWIQLGNCKLFHYQSNQIYIELEWCFTHFYTCISSRQETHRIGPKNCLIVIAVAFRTT